VDDDEAILELIKAILDPDYDVEAVPASAAVIGLLRRHRYDLLIVDLWMSQLGGAELVRLVRREPKADTVPIAVMSECAELPSMFGGERVEAAIPKPFTVNELQSTVAAILLHRQGRASAGREWDRPAT
jgi:DNA-binding response OmpR family regulator